MGKEKGHWDWLPVRREMVLELADAWLEYINPERASAWKIPAADITELSGKRNAARAMLAAVTGPDASPRVRTACRTAFAELRGFMRRFKNAYFRKPELQAGDFTALGLAVPGGSRAPVPKPEAEAPFSMRREGYMVVLVHHGRRPYGTIGAQLRYAVLAPGAPPPVYGQLTEMKLLTRINGYLEFPDTLEGHTLYAALSWLSERGESGPPSQIQSIVLG